MLHQLSLIDSNMEMCGDVVDYMRTAEQNNVLNVSQKLDFFYKPDVTHAPSSPGEQAQIVVPEHQLLYSMLLVGSPA